MQSPKQMATEAAGFVESLTRKAPVVGIMTGTGLGDIAETMAMESVVEYEDIPHFPRTTAIGHTGKLLLGSLQGKQVITMQGRFHLYEGYTPQEVTFPIRVMQELGVNAVVLSNAAGGINPDYRQGDIMLITDHINLTGTNPLVGPNEETWGLRFPDMINTYDRSLIAAASTAASEMGYGVREGVYAGLLGPSLETPAEIRFLSTIGADAVGLSTVMEAIAAVHGGMRVLGISAITNMNTPDATEPTTAEAVIETARATAPKMMDIIRRVVENLA
jgi:purine-nucleoside phosphorylase